MTEATTALNSGLEAWSDSLSTKTDSSTVSSKPPRSMICSARRESPASASAGSRVLVPITLPSARATNTKASHPKIAIFRWAALQRPMRAARFWDLASGVMASFRDSLGGTRRLAGRMPSGNVATPRLRVGLARAADVRLPPGLLAGTAAAKQGVAVVRSPY